MLIAVRMASPEPAGLVRKEVDQSKSGFDCAWKYRSARYEAALGTTTRRSSRSLETPTLVARLAKCPEMCQYSP